MSFENKVWGMSLICLLSMMISCGPLSEGSPAGTVANPLLGSWQMTSIHWVTKDTTYSIEEAQPGLLLINPSRYAIMWTPTDEPRVPFQKLSAPTDEELKAGFRSIVFNAGRYQYTDSTLTTEAMIAKVPGFEGGKQYYRFTLTGDQLTLTMFDETYPDGKKPEWFGRYVTTFLLKRVDN
ncbi:MAG TPA: lipocalin-like domain-containing protein [Calditrichia bacterium]|nr:lipocalin-like domain-containing protein [Calditrichia bacterium]